MVVCLSARIMYKCCFGCGFDSGPLRQLKGLMFLRIFFSGWPTVTVGILEAMAGSSVKNNFFCEIQIWIFIKRFYRGNWILFSIKLNDWQLGNAFFRSYQPNIQIWIRYNKRKRFTDNSSEKPWGDGHTGFYSSRRRSRGCPARPSCGPLAAPATPHTLTLPARLL